MCYDGTIITATNTKKYNIIVKLLLLFPSVEYYYSLFFFLLNNIIKSLVMFYNERFLFTILYYCLRRTLSDIQIIIIISFSARCYFPPISKPYYNKYDFRSAIRTKFQLFHLFNDWAKCFPYEDRLFFFFEKR